MESRIKGGDRDGGDRPPSRRAPAARAVQVLLAIYLLPVVALVLVIGGVVMAIQGVARLLGMAASAPAARPRGGLPGRLGPHVEVASTLPQAVESPIR